MKVGWADFGGPPPRGQMEVVVLPSEAQGVHGVSELRVGDPARNVADHNGSDGAAVALKHGRKVLALGRPLNC